MNNFVVVTFSHKKMCVEERSAVLRSDPAAVLQQLKESGVISGYVYLSTCLRVELYIYHSGSCTPDTIADIIPDMPYDLYGGEDAVRYLFTVICGMESVIIGENQILAQLKKAYIHHMEQGCTCPELNAVFNQAVALGKRFRAQSGIDSHGISLERSVVKYLKQSVKNPEAQRFFLIGIGDLTKSLLYIFRKMGLTKITVTTKTTHKLKQLKTDFNVAGVSFADLNETLWENDVVISATSAPHCIVQYEEFVSQMPDSAPRLILDLAVPRDFDERIADLPGVAYVTLDDIFSLSKENMQRREETAAKYAYLVDEQIAECCRWFENRKIRMCGRLAQ